MGRLGNKMLPRIVRLLPEYLHNIDTRGTGAKRYVSIGDRFSTLRWTVFHAFYKSIQSDIPCLAEVCKRPLVAFTPFGAVFYEFLDSIYMCLFHP